MTHYAEWLKIEHKNVVTICIVTSYRHTSYSHKYVTSRTKQFKSGSGIHATEPVDTMTKWSGAVQDQIFLNC